jgi:hypothetical protein
MRIVSPDEEPVETPEPVSLSDHAFDNLRFIRSTLEHAGSFTAVPGIGGVIMGITALVAAAIAAGQATPTAWFAVWVVEAIVAFLIGGVAMLYKARGANNVLFSVPGRRFALALTPALLAGAMLTVALARDGRFDLMPPIWLLLYGAAVMAGGALSVRAIPFMGLTFLVLGSIALFLPGYGDLLMAAGFGGAQIVTGMVIARRYGG